MPPKTGRLEEPAAVATTGQRMPSEGAEHPAPVPGRTMVLYSVANAGTNAVAAFTNAALPLYLPPYGLPGWLVGLLAQERSGVGGLVQPVIRYLSDRTRSRFGRRRPYPMLADLIPEDRAGEFTGLGSMLWSLCQPIGALLGGALADVSGGYRFTFIFGGLMMFIALALLQTVHPPTVQDTRNVAFDASKENPA